MFWPDQDSGTGILMVAFPARLRPQFLQRPLGSCQCYDPARRYCVLIRILFPLELTNCNIDTVMNTLNTPEKAHTSNFFLIKCLSVLLTTGLEDTALIQILFLHWVFHLWHWYCDLLSHFQILLRQNFRLHVFQQVVSTIWFLMWSQNTCLAKMLKLFFKRIQQGKGTGRHILTLFWFISISMSK